MRSIPLNLFFDASLNITNSGPNTVKYLDLNRMLLFFYSLAMKYKVWTAIKAVCKTLVLFLPRKYLKIIMIQHILKMSLVAKCVTLFS